MGSAARRHDGTERRYGWVWDSEELRASEAVLKLHGGRRHDLRQSSSRYTVYEGVGCPRRDRCSRPCAEPPNPLSRPKSSQKASHHQDNAEGIQHRGTPSLCSIPGNSLLPITITPLQTHPSVERHWTSRLLRRSNAIQEEAHRLGHRILHLEVRSHLPAAEVEGTAVHRIHLGCRRDVHRHTILQ
jgi:hypothetical protein